MGKASRNKLKRIHEESQKLPLHVKDQARAAAEANKSTVGQGMMPRNLNPDISSTLIAKLFADDTKLCPHVKSPQPLVFFINKSVISCHHCVKMFVSELVSADNNNCDICDLVPEDKQYTNFAVPMEMVTAVGDCCNSCRSKMGE